MFLCHSADKSLRFIKQETTEDPDCDLELTYQSQKGCAVVNYGTLLKFIKENKIFWGAGLILIGIFFAFFGNGLVTIVFFMVSAIATFGLLIWLTFTIILDKVVDS